MTKALMSVAGNDLVASIYDLWLKSPFTYIVFIASGSI